MPPKPTCKVVKREGQRGARIDPKGCKVRTTKDAQGNKKKETKQDEGIEQVVHQSEDSGACLDVAGASRFHMCTIEPTMRTLRATECKALAAGGT